MVGEAEEQEEVTVYRMLNNWLLPCGKPVKTEPEVGKDIQQIYKESKLFRAELKSKLVTKIVRSVHYGLAKCTDYNLYGPISHENNGKFCGLRIKTPEVF